MTNKICSDLRRIFDEQNEIEVLESPKSVQEIVFDGLGRHVDCIAIAVSVAPRMYRFIQSRFTHFIE